MSGPGHNGGPDRWIKLWESTFDHWLVGRHNPEYFTAWQDLVMQCRYADGYINAAGSKMLLKRGSLLGAVSFLAHRWKWSPKKVRVFLDKLEADGMIKLTRPGVQKGKQKGKMPTIISACNYELYQNPDTPEWQAEGQARGTQGASEGQARGKNHKKGNKGNNNNITARETPLPDFSYGQNDFQLDAKGKLMLVNGERATWIDCFGGNDKALEIALVGFTPNREYKGQQTLAKHARHYLNQQAQAFNRNGGRAADNRSKRSDAIDKAMREQEKNGGGNAR